MKVDQLDEVIEALADRGLGPGHLDEQRHARGKLELGLLVPEPMLAQLPCT